MDTLRVIASKREERDYSSREIPDEALTTILQAGRIAGTAKNTQHCRFTAIRDSSPARGSLGKLVTRPGNLEGAAALIVVTTVDSSPKSSFDAGRAAQNMMLAAWDLGIGSCPNNVTDPERLVALLELPEGESPVTVLSLGYPSRRRDPGSRDFEAWIAGIDRAPFEAVTRRI
jgi:nitroreductase